MCIRDSICYVQNVRFEIESFFKMLNCLVWNNIVVKMLQKVQGVIEVYICVGFVCLVPVSYTHLDVYKRQVGGCLPLVARLFRIPVPPGGG